jgi:hypothetical protein
LPSKNDTRDMKLLNCNLHARERSCVKRGHCSQNEGDPPRKPLAGVDVRARTRQGRPAAAVPRWPLPSRCSIAPNSQWAPAVLAVSCCAPHAPAVRRWNCEIQLVERCNVFRQAVVRLVVQTV